MMKVFLSRVLRQTRLLHAADYLRYLWQRQRTAAMNRRFRREHPDVALPPDYLMYESFQLDYSKYYTGGRETADWLCGYIRKYQHSGSLTVLDWGCGPGRIIRHLPELLGQEHHYLACDYNPVSITWCKDQIPGVFFFQNPLQPPLDLANGSVDVFYGISIFTHLSEPLHQEWFSELLRILKPGGLLLLTFQGSSFRKILTASEQVCFDAGKLVVRGQVREGHRIYSAFHPKQYLQRLFSGTRILEQVERPDGPDGKPHQDLWVLQKEAAPDVAQIV